MPDAISPARLVLTTAANPEEAARLGLTLVEERLAACATLIPGAQSIYRWQGAVEVFNGDDTAHQDWPGATCRSGSTTAPAAQLRDP